MNAAERTWIPGVGYARPTPPKSPKPKPPPVTRTAPETQHTVTVESTLSPPDGPPRTLAEIKQDITDAIDELDGCELSAAVRQDLSWMRRRTQRIGR